MLRALYFLFGLSCCSVLYTLLHERLNDDDSVVVDGDNDDDDAYLKKAAATTCTDEIDES